MKSLFPLFTCSGVKVTVFVAFKGRVRTASSNSTAQEEEKEKEEISPNDMKRMPIFFVRFFIRKDSNVYQNMYHSDLL
jgi:hypothetical protein